MDKWSRGAVAGIDAENGPRSFWEVLRAYRPGAPGPAIKETPSPTALALMQRYDIAMSAVFALEAAGFAITRHAVIPAGLRPDHQTDSVMRFSDGEDFLVLVRGSAA